MLIILIILISQVRMVVVESAGVASGNVLCRVVEPGMVSSRKGVNVPGTLVELPSIGPKVSEEWRK